MKRVLLTNFSVKNFTGSEIDIVTIANYFVKEKYEVDIFTLDQGLPLTNLLSNKVRIISMGDENKLRRKYDLIWSHHHPLLDYILFNQKIKSDYIFYISLSAFEPYESLPIYCNELSLVGSITNEIKNQLVKEGCIKDNIVVFPNYASNDFFENEIRKVNKIKKICIVSNHVPDELLKLKEIAEKKNIDVDIYGKNYIQKFVDKELLDSYDVIISIGKTIYYAISMGKLAYCYDYFGGYGFINRENIKNSFKYNFSGRKYGKKMTEKEILEDIINHFDSTQNDLEYLKKFAYDNFHFENNMKKTIKKIEKKKVDCNKLLEKYNTLTNRNSKLFVEKYFILNTMINNIKNENEYLKSKTQELVNSTSWKITKPIRLLKRIGLKILKKLNFK